MVVVSGKVVVIVFEQRTFIAFLISGFIFGDCTPELSLVYIYNRACASVVYLVQRDLSP